MWIHKSKRRLERFHCKNQLNMRKLISHCCNMESKLLCHLLRYRKLFCIEQFSMLKLNQRSHYYCSFHLLYRELSLQDRVKNCDSDRPLQLMDELDKNQFAQWMKKCLLQIHKQQGSMNPLSFLKQLQRSKLLKWRLPMQYYKKFLHNLLVQNLMEHLSLKVD